MRLGGRPAEVRAAVRAVLSCDDVVQLVNISWPGDRYISTRYKDSIRYLHIRLCTAEFFGGPLWLAEVSPRSKLWTPVPIAPTA